MALDPSDLIANLLGGGYFRAGQDQANAVLDRPAQQQAQQQQLAIGAMQIAGAQQQAQQQQAYASDVAAYNADPTPQRLSALALKYPQQAAALKQSKDILDEPAKQSQLTQFGTIYNLADNAKPADLSSHLSQIIAAEKQQGVDTTDAQAILDGLNSSDPAQQQQALTNAKAFSRINLAALGAKGFEIDPNPTDNANHFSTAGDGVIYDQRTGRVVREASGKTVTVKNADGSESVVQVGGGDPSSGGAAAPGGSGAPLSVRLNNPGAIRYDPKNQWQGQVGNSDGFVQFDTTSNGQRAHQKLIANQIKGGYDTPLSWAQHYAPASDGNDPQAYAQTIAKGLGIGVGDRIPLSAVPHMAALSAQVEAGGTPTSGTTSPPGGARVLFTSKGSTSGVGGALSNDALQLMVDQYRAGDKTVLQNLGRGKQGAGNVVAFRNLLATQAKRDGLTGADLSATMAEYQGDVAASRAAGTRLAQVETAANEAKRLAPIALRTSNILSRAGWLPLAKVQQAIRNGTNSPPYRAFNAANNALVNAYSRAISPSGAPTDSQRQHAYDLLNTAYDQDSYKATVSQMMTEIDAALASPRDTRSGIREAVHGLATNRAVPTATATNPKTGQKLGLVNGHWIALGAGQ